MKVPFSSNQNTPSVNPKPASNNNNNNNLRSITTFQGIPAAAAAYEPKSVLELRRSPSPVTDQKPVSNNTDQFSSLWDDSIPLEDHVLSDSENWDFMKDLGLNDQDSTKPSSQLCQTESQTQYLSLPEFPPVHHQSFDSSHHNQFVPSDFNLSDIFGYGPAFENPNDVRNHMTNNNIGFECVDELIRLAECFETNSLHLTHVILGRLNQRLRSPNGKPLQRAAFYFKEALQTLLTGSTRSTRASSSSEVIQSIKSIKSFSNISPIPMFSSFTANQAVLEAVDDGSILIHVIDFDIGLGGQWASFLKELADKAQARKANSPVLRITAVVGEEYAMESKLIRENLSQFARELNIGFNIDFVLIRTFEFLSFKSIKFMEGEKIAVLLSPTIFRSVGTGFLNDLSRIGPHVVVHVDSEGLMGSGTTTFRQTVIDGLEFYSTLLESLEAANGGAGDDWMRKIESFVLFPKILEAVGAAGRRGMPWREAFVAAGLRPVTLSQFADFQADCLIRRVQVAGFHVARRQAEMLLCWQERALVTTSAWR